MKTSDKLYNINRNISLFWIGLNDTPTLKELENLNLSLGDIIKEVRELENKIGEKEE